MSSKVLLRGLLAAAVVASAVAAQADVFNMPGGLTSLQFATVGDPGNVADTMVMTTDQTTGYGAVNYIYQIGKYEVTTAQYCQFLNAVAAADSYGLYSTNMANPASTGPWYHGVGCGILRSGSSGSYTYSVVSGRENYPVNYVPWVSAIRFCNWLQNGQPTGLEGPGTTETGAYALRETSRR